MSCHPAQWASVGDALLSDVLARLPFRGKMSVESVCTAWCHLLRSQPSAGLWGDKFFLLERPPITNHDEWQGTRLFPGTSQQRVLRLINSVVHWLRHRAKGLQAISLGRRGHYQCFEVHRFNTALLNCLLHQLEHIKGLPVLELYVCFTDETKDPYRWSWRRGTNI